MPNVTEIPSSVWELIRDASRRYGRMQEDSFSQLVFRGICDQNITSPIEQLLYVALNSVREFAGIEEPNIQESNSKLFIIGLYIEPQYEVGKYRADFLVSFSKIGEGQTQLCKEVLVECDSQAFHDRTEPERRYEKQRDRFFVSRGYTPLHFTGKEIIQDPYRVASEIISFVTGDTEDNLMMSVLITME